MVMRLFVGRGEGEKRVLGETAWLGGEVYANVGLGMTVSGVIRPRRSKLLQLSGGLRSQPARTSPEIGRMLAFVR